MKAQHTLPCNDCPWRRVAIRSWLGSFTAQEWIDRAMGEFKVDCHTHTKQQCAGMAIFRANVCKLPRYREILVLDPNTNLVFKTPAEFIKHHTLK